MHFVKQKTEFIAYLLTVKTTKQTLAKVIRYIFYASQQQLYAEKNKTAICLPTDSCFLVFPDFLIYEFLSALSLLQRCQGSTAAEYE